MLKHLFLCFLMCAISIASSCQKGKNEEVLSINSQLRKSGIAARSDSSAIQGPSHYLAYLIQNSGDTSLLFQAKREESRIRDSIMSLRNSGINVFLADGSYNPVFVGQANTIIDSSAMPLLFKEYMKSRMWGISSPTNLE